MFTVYILINFGGLPYSFSCVTSVPLVSDHFLPPIDKEHDGQSEFLMRGTLHPTQHQAFATCVYLNSANHL